MKLWVNYSPIDKIIILTRQLLNEVILINLWVYFWLAAYLKRSDTSKSTEVIEGKRRTIPKPSIVPGKGKHHIRKRIAASIEKKKISRLAREEKCKTIYLKLITCQFFLFKDKVAVPQWLQYSQQKKYRPVQYTLMYQLEAL